MSDHAATAQDDGAKRPISPIWVLIGIIMLVALYTTVHGLYALTGSYVYAIPFGVVAQSILLIVSLNLGRDIARKATGRTGELKISPTARTLRSAFLIAVYLLFFGICWFFAFSTYYNIFLARGDDVQTTSSQAVLLGDQAIPEMRTRIEKHVTNAREALRNGELVTGFNNKIGELLEAAGRPEVGKTIADAARDAAQKAFQTRQDQRKQWRDETTTLEQRQTTLRTLVTSAEQELTKKKEEREGLPNRIRDLNRAIQEEATGVLPPLPDEPAAPARDPAGQATPTPPRTAPAPPPVRTGQLKADGLASTLVTAAACRVARGTGRGDCSTALETALRQAEARVAALPREISDAETKLEPLRAEAEALPKRLDQLAKLLNDNPSLAAPLPRDSTAGLNSGPDLGPLAKARDAFRQTPSEQTFSALVDACQPIETALRGLKPPPPVVSGFACRAEPVQAAIKTHQTLLEQQQKFLASCSQSAVTSGTAAIVGRMRDDFSRPDSPLRSDDTKRRERLGQAIDEVRGNVLDPCFNLATPLGVKLDDLNKAARDFEEKVAPRQTDFSLASNAVVQVVQLQATPPAYLGALFAAAQELAILLLSILRDINFGARAAPARAAASQSGLTFNWGRDPADPPGVAAAKILLHAPDTRRDGSVYLPASFGEDEKPEIQANIQQLLRELRRDKLAKPARFRRGTRLTPEGVENLERRVRDHYGASRPAEKAGSGPPLVASAITAATSGQRADQRTSVTAEMATSTAESRFPGSGEEEVAEAGEEPARGGRSNVRQIGTRA
jgi:hypothetical protein